MAAKKEARSAETAETRTSDNCCPNCGACKECGAGGVKLVPYPIPYPVYPPPQPRPYPYWGTTSPRWQQQPSWAGTPQPIAYTSSNATNIC